MMRLLDLVFPFWRAALEIRFNERAMLWLLLLLLLFGPGVAYAILA